ncbi:hypothetical protein B0H15DRAFT_955006 [Mycena belliarum]|uniref:CxC1-like cysteine cluster associated with KDZ transposases domain-containing protein n=1 Tax=Mycena belliarum TaxID=1033014 RepID=A0AAD6TRZ8_9AGAR|nr:hypothetical protein B0H15DRAFT_955006 [Mycena belliae]
MKRGRGIIKASSNSRKLSIMGSGYSIGGRLIRTSEILSTSRSLDRKNEELNAERLHRQELTATARISEDAHADVPTLNENEGDLVDNFAGVLDGTARADFSHAGEDFAARLDMDEDELMEDLQASHNRLFSKRRDFRKWRTRTQKLVDGFQPQMEGIADAYVAWELRSSEEGLGTFLGPPSDAMVQNYLPTMVVDLFSAHIVDIPLLAGDDSLSSGFVNQGYFPCSPTHVTVTLTTRVLEVFRVASLRCPRLAIQPFVKSLCDIHGIPFRPYLSTQFSVAFDLYLATRAIVDARVKVLLKRDEPDWRLKNACPACMYALEDEPPLDLPFLSTKDGNNSLKRWNRRERGEDGAAGPSKERHDNRTPPGDYYLTRAEVDVWAKEGLDDLLKGFVPADDEEGWEPEAGGCSDRWQNMREDVTSKAWGMYDETGIFLSLCRHGFVLLVTDMVQSGELGKYGFAVTNHLIKVLGEVAEGYDIGCEFGERINKHPVLGPYARHHRHRSLVGAFHGHGHCRLCQLTHLATYVDGVGLEDLEYCERFFSKSNALVPSTRYASRFHRQQAIATYLQHTDTFETYQSLSLLLVNKYKGALEVQRMEPALLEAMRDLGVAHKSTFAGWLAREKEVLTALKREPVEETLAMEYYQKLVNLAAASMQMDNVLRVGTTTSLAPSHDDYEAQAKATRRLEAQQRHAIEGHTKAQLLVNDMELRMSIAVCWLPDSQEWIDAAVMVRRRRYQRALDHLQGLIIARMFELTKMNMSGTGYKLRKHIAKALQARSRAVQTAVVNYNAAASRLSPPRDELTWEQVVDYAFLSDFDLLCDGREDIRDEPWAKPSGRIAMDLYFKIERAGEEVERLNIEIRRLVTYMRDEDGFLRRAWVSIRESAGEAMAHQVHLYWMRQGPFHDEHRYRRHALQRLLGFSGSLEPGTPINKDRLPPPGAAALPPRAPSLEPERGADSDDSNDEAELFAERYALLRVTQDDSGSPDGARDPGEIGL